MAGRNASEGIEPRNSHHRTGPRVPCSGSQYRCTRYRRVCGGVPGSESVAGYRTVYVGTWETRAVPDAILRSAYSAVVPHCGTKAGSSLRSTSASARQAGEARKAYGGAGVGPTHSRGVAGAMPGATARSLEGVGSRTQRDEEATARR